MKLKGRAYYIRKTHRYLGIFIGIQFVLWTLGGLYFSWTNLDEIHGDHLYHAMAQVDPSMAIISPSEAIKGNVPDGRIVDMAKLKVVTVFGEPYYSMMYRDGEAREQFLLIHAGNGKARQPITEAEARIIAAGSMHAASGITSVDLISKEMMGSHHEYREKPLPAWAVTFDHPEGVTAYVGANDGQVHAVRTNSWRLFDFLWMLHTMDLAGRDNINNYVLRGFSILGIVTVMSGFLLFFISSKNVRRILMAVRKRNA
ncbi:MAG: hypothetical protein KIT61_11550 [Pyrinomonadaceae bacterium]|nr:hypothetical protein [Blastocatellia bacterium]MCW5957213.1 hypothetical protein [Pyrinomonadaceae bacterium]